VTQTVFTVITKVKPSEVDALKGVLTEIGADPAANAVLPLGGFDTLHFASLVLVEADKLPPTLIFEHNVDGSSDSWLETLAAKAGPGLDAIYAHCVGYPAGAGAAGVSAYLGDHVVRPGAFHVGATGRSLARIRQEARLRELIEAHIESELAGGKPPSDSPGWRASVQAFVKRTPELSWAKTTPKGKPPHHQTRGERFGHVARLAALLAAAVVAIPVLVPILLVWLPWLLWKERTDPVQANPADPAQIAALSATEDLPAVAQNHLASVIRVKPGLLRAVTLPVVLFVLNLVARVNATKGQLAGIPSIHFAHWSRMNDGRHLMFLSNFDGSWESYLGDFIDKAATGLTAVWTNTVEFPKTHLLIKEGATDGPKFRQWARAHQCPTAVWYTAYPEYTMSIIDNNTAIREGLWGSMDEGKAKEWLRRL
jgi:hypothetical protein